MLAAKWLCAMHEMALAEGLIQLIENAASEQGFARVRMVRLEIGRLSAVEPVAIRFCFDAVARGSIAEGAVLDIIELPGAGCCMDCAAMVSMQTPYDTCPCCGSSQVQATSGTEMRVKELEVN